MSRYKNELLKEDKVKLKKLMEKQKHRLVRVLYLQQWPSSWTLNFGRLPNPFYIQVTPEILRDLDESRNRGEYISFNNDMVYVSSPIYLLDYFIS